MADVIQANLKPKTVQRIADIAERPVTRGIDKMINECLDKLSSDVRPCVENSEENPTESESDNEKSK